MAEGVVTFALERLVELLVDSIVQEVKLLSGVRDQVDSAKAELRRMRSFLKDADARAREGDERVRNWVAEIREATYDLEDAIVTYAAKVVPKREGGVRNVLKRLACLFCQGIELHRVGTQIEKISAGLSSLRGSLETYGVRDLSVHAETSSSRPNERQSELRRAYSHVVEQDLVGLDEIIERLVAVLVRQVTPLHRVVSICGMGGSGKTTLARKLYQHSEIRGHFDCVAWAVISQQCEASSVWREILGKLCPGETTPENEICRKLYGIQKERKCLIVLDDIWTTEIWDCLSPAFPRDETKSRIIVTTRNKDVALHIDVNGFVHEPPCLTDEESWELFEKVFRQFRTNLDEIPKRKKLGREMLKHCGGLPLAIIVLRELLSRKQALFEWEAMQNNAKMYINDGKMSELRDSKNLGVSWVLGLSYNELPYQLKSCFLHLAHFPEDHVIKVGELCQMWMAEGFVPSEEMAYDYLYELAQRCMIQRGETSAINGKIKTCRVHDLMRDLCLLKAREENFLQAVSLTGSEEENNIGYMASNKVRRVAMMFSNNDVLSHDQLVLTIIRDDCVRSAMFFNRIHFKLKTMASWFKCFHMLRVLKFERQNIHIPNEIGELFQLRFLSFKGCRVRGGLPSSLRKLRGLQTLDLEDLESDAPIRNLGKWRLDRLRHLYLPKSPFLGNNLAMLENLPMLENASHLRTLVGIRTSYPGFRRLALLTNLTKLNVYYFQNWAAGVTFHSLHSLVVSTRPDGSEDITPIISSFPEIYKLKLVFGIEKLPEHKQFSHELVKLTLDRTILWKDPMPTLEKLPKLRILRLMLAFFQLDEIVCSSGGFPCLESLHFYRSIVIKEWKVDKGALPNLCHLSSHDSLLSRTFPDSLLYVTTLKEIELGKTESRIVNELKGRDQLYKYPLHLQSLLLNAHT